MRFHAHRCVISVVLCVALIIGAFSASITGTAALNGETVIFTEEFANANNWEQVGTAEDNAVHGAFSDGTSNYLQLSGKSTYALNKSAYADSLMRYELKTRFTLKNNTNSNRFVLYYYYKNDTEYKTIEIFKQDNRDTLGMQMGLLTENVSGSANATNAGIIKSNVALKDASGNELAWFNDEDHYYTLTVVYTSATTVQVTVDNGAAHCTFTYNGKSGLPVPYWVGTDTKLTDNERYDAYFTNSNMRSERIGVGVLGKSLQTTFVDFVSLRLYNENATENDMVCDYYTYSHAEALSLSAAQVQLSDEDILIAAINKYLKLSVEQQEILKPQYNQLQSVYEALDEQKVPPRDPAQDLDPITFDFEASDQLDVWRAYGISNQSTAYGIVDNPSLSGANTAAGKVLKLSGDSTACFYTLHKNMWSQNGMLTTVRGKLYGKPDASRPISILYYYKNSNNYKSVDLLFSNNEWAYIQYASIEGYTDKSGASIVKVGNGQFGLTNTVTEWVNFELAYSEDAVKFTLSYDDGRSASVVLKQSSSIFYQNVNGTMQNVSEPQVDLTSERVAYKLSKHAYVFLDDLSYSFLATADGYAEQYTSDYAAVLSLTEKTVATSDKAAVNAAIDAFNKLPFAAQQSLTTELELLNQLLERIEDLEIMEQIGMSQVRLPYTLEEDFEGNYALDCWKKIKGGVKNNLKVVTEGDNHILEVTSNDGEWTPRSFLWPDKASMSHVTLHMKLDDSIGIMNGTPVYYSYVDEDNWSRIYIFRHIEEEYSWRIERCIDGVSAASGAGTFPAINCQDWFTIDIDYDPKALQCNLMIWSDSDPDTVGSVSDRLLHPKARLVLAGTSAHNSQTCKCWYDDITVTFQQGDWDEDVTVDTPQVYYQGNTWLRPGNVAVLYGENLFANIRKVELVRLSDLSEADLATAQAEYILLDSYYEKASEANYTSASDPAAHFIGTPIQVPIVQGSENAVKFIVPEDLEEGIYAVKFTPKNVYADDKYVYINVPTMSALVGDQGEIATPGGTVRAIGSNLAAKMSGTVPVSDSAAIADMNVKAQLKASDGTVYHCEITEVQSQYSVTAKVPENITYGTYEFTVYNGYGDTTAWAKPISITIGADPRDAWKKEVFDVTKYGAVGDGQHNDTPAIVNALAAAAANGGGVVYLPIGIYRIIHTIAIPEGVVFKGDGRTNSKIVITPYNWDWEDFPDAMLSIDGNVEICDLAFYAARVGKIIKTFASKTENIYIHDLYIQTSPHSGTITDGNYCARTDYLTTQEMQYYALQEARSFSTPVISMGSCEVTNYQLYNNEMTAYLGGFGGGKYYKSDISDNIFFATYGGFSAFTLMESVFENNDTLRYGFGAYGSFNKSYWGNNKLSTNITNNRELFTTDGSPYYGVKRDGSIKKVNETTYQIVTGQSYTANYWQGKGLYVLEGNGVCQVRKIIASYENNLIIDSPFVVEPNRNSRVCIHDYRVDLRFVGTEATEGSTIGTYGTLCGAVFDSNTVYNMQGISLWAFDDSPNWFNSLTNNNLYDGYFFHAGGVLDSSGCSVLRVRASGLTNTSTATVLRNNTLTDNFRILIEAQNVKSVRDMVIDQNNISDSSLGIKIVGNANYIDSVLIYNNTFDNVSTPYDYPTAMASAKNEQGYVKLMLLKTYYESDEGMKLGDVDADGEISLKDSTMIKLYLAGRLELTSDQLKRADTNADGKISVVDSAMIRQYLIGKVVIGSDPTHGSSSSDTSEETSSDMSSSGDTSSPDDTSSNNTSSKDTSSNESSADGESSSESSSGETSSQDPPQSSSSQDSSDSDEWLGPY